MSSCRSKALQTPSLKPHLCGRVQQARFDSTLEGFCMCEGRKGVELLMLAVVVVVVVVVVG